MTTQAMAVAGQPGALAPNNLGTLGIFGLEDYDGTEFRVGRWRIVQSVKQQEEWGAPLGSFYNPDTQEQAKALALFHIVRVRTPRSFSTLSYDEFIAKKDAGQDPKLDCWSEDGKVPHAEAPNRQATACAVCPRAKFVRQADGSFKASECTEQRRLFLMDEHGVPSLITVRKEACQEVDKAIQPLVHKRLAPIRVPVTISLEKRTGKTVYWVPKLTFHLDRILGEEETMRLQGEAVGFMALFTRAAAGEQDEHQGEHVAAPSASSARVVVVEPEPEEAPAAGGVVGEDAYDESGEFDPTKVGF